MNSWGRPLIGVFFALALGLVSACSSESDWVVPPPSTEPARGDVVAIERVGGYSRIFAKAMVWAAGMSDRVSVTHGVDLYRVTYWTQDETENLVTATGLLSRPRGTAANAVLSWHHGTSVTRHLVPSKPTPDEGVLASIAFAGHGYLLLAPDYVGLGGSLLPHPYYHAPTAAANIRDLIKAAQTLYGASQKAWPKRLFMTGFSQGGYNTFAALRDLQRTPLPDVALTAAASIGAPFDLAGFSFPNALKGEAQSASLYLAYIINSYARIYDEPLESVLREPFATHVPQIFSGNLEGDAVVAALPRNPRDLFTPEALARFDAGDWGWVGRYLTENSLVDFVPAVPVRLYYGRNDVDVSPSEAQTQAKRWAAVGKDVVAEDVGPFDHNASVIEAAPRLRNWFDAFLNEGTRPDE